MMIQGHQSLFHVTINGYSHAIELLKAEISDYMSELSHGWIEAKVRFPLEPTCTGAKISIEWRSGTNIQYWHGMITEIIPQVNDTVRMKVGSVLYMLEYLQQSKHYVDQNLKSMMVDLLSPVYDASHIVFELTQALPELELISHQYENAMAALERLIHDYALFYYEKYDMTGSTLIIQDRNQSHSTPAAIAMHYSEAELTGSESSVVISLLGRHHWQVSGLKGIAYDPKFPQIVMTCTSSGADSGPYTEVFHGHAKTMEDLKKLTQAQYDALNTAAHYIEMTSVCLEVKAGGIITVSGHPDDEYNRSYLVVSVTHHMDESQQKLLSSSKESQRRYENTLIAHPLDIPYQPDKWPKKTEKSILRTGLIHSDDAAQPSLDADGKYQLIFDYHVSDEVLQPCRAISALTPYAGNGFGLHCPLHADTQVLTLCLNGNPDQPVILGALYHARQDNPVTASQPHHNRLRSYAGHELLLDDTPQKEAIRLSSAQDHCYLHMDSQEAGEMITLRNQTGDMMLDAGRHMQQMAGKMITVEAGEDIVLSAEQLMHLTSDESNILISAGADMSVHVGHSWKSRIAQDMQLDITGHYLYQSQGSYQLEVVNGDYSARLEKGAIRWASQTGVSMISQEGDIHIGCGNTMIAMMQSGDMKIQAKTLKVTATQIEASHVAVFSKHT